MTGAILHDIGNCRGWRTGLGGSRGESFPKNDAGNSNQKATQNVASSRICPISGRICSSLFSEDSSLPEGKPAGHSAPIGARWKSESPGWHAFDNSSKGGPQFQNLLRGQDPEEGNPSERAPAMYGNFAILKIRPTRSHPEKGFVCVSGSGILPVRAPP